MSSRSRSQVAGAIALAGLLAAGCGGPTTGASPGATASASPASDLAGTPTEAPVTASPTGSWHPIADGPLSPRASATAAWTGREVLVFGGHDLPCPITHCYPNANDVLVDGAAYHPVTDTWRPIAPAPVPVLYAQTALVGEILYVRAASADAYSPESPPRWFAYEVAADRWREIRSGPENGQPVAAGGTLFAHRPVPHGSEPAFSSYDPETDSWADLPDDELGANLDRAGLGDGQRLYSIAYDWTSAEVKARIASFDLGTRAWERLPDPPIGALPTTVVGGHLVDPEGQYTAAYNPDTRQWSVGAGHPDEPTTGNDNALKSHLVGPGLVVASSNLVLDADTMRWWTLPPHEALGGDDVPFESVADVAAAWAGDRLFVWGGVRRWDQAEGEEPPVPVPATRLRDTGWVWVPSTAGG